MGWRSFGEELGFGSQHDHRGLSGGADPAASWQYRWAVSTTSGQTARAADALEVDMPPRDQ
jgi:hypothetical protein